MSTHPGSPSTVSIVNETALDTGDTDLIMTVEQFNNLDQHFKRRIAGAANTDEITGKSTELEIRSYVVRQRHLGEYADN
jgi:hypothetical protein